MECFSDRTQVCRLYSVGACACILIVNYLEPTGHLEQLDVLSESAGLDPQALLARPQRSTELNDPVCALLRAEDGPWIRFLRRPASLFHGRIPHLLASLSRLAESLLQRRACDCLHQRGSGTRRFFSGHQAQLRRYPPVENLVPRGSAGNSVPACGRIGGEADPEGITRAGRRLRERLQSPWDGRG